MRMTDRLIETAQETARNYDMRAVDRMWESIKRVNGLSLLESG